MLFRDKPFNENLERKKANATQRIEINEERKQHGLLGNSPPYSREEQ